MEQSELKKKKEEVVKMKTGLVLVSVAAFLALTPVVAIASDQLPLGAMNELSLDLASPVFYNLAATNGYAIPIYVNYQRVLMNHLVLSITPDILYMYDNWLGAQSVISLWVELDWHPFQDGLQGFFIGPAVIGAYSDGLFLPHESGASALIGATIGYQIFFSSNIDFDMAAGMAIGTRPDGQYSGLIRMVLGLGYRF